MTTKTEKEGRGAMTPTTTNNATTNENLGELTANEMKTIGGGFKNAGEVLIRAFCLDELWKPLTFPF